MSKNAPPELDEVRAAAEGILATLPPQGLLVLLAGAPGDEAAGIWMDGAADLAGLSRPDLCAAWPVPAGAADVASAVGLLTRRGPPPVDLAVLALLAAAHAPGTRAVLPVAVPWRDGDGLRELGAQLVRALPSEAGPATLLAAGDLSAGLSPKAPRHVVDGAEGWDAAAVAALRRGDAAALAALGPEEAQRCGSRSWPALVALLGALAPSGLRLASLRYQAPRGVGLVTAGR